MNNIVEIKNLKKQYKHSDKVAVDDISFTVKPGEIIGFIGPNGAGKSTTIKCMIGVLDFNKGEINILNKPLKDNPLEAKMNIGYVPDVSIAYDLLSGRELIDFVAGIYKVENNIKNERLNRYLKLFGLESAIEQQIKTYSHGMKQKISIIASLIHNPKLWVLDEPMTGLDPQSSYNLKMLMKEHCKEGGAVFFSSHVLEVVEKLCDKIIIINKGKLILECTLAELKEKQENMSLETFFLNLIGDNTHLNN